MENEKKLVSENKLSLSDMLTGDSTVPGGLPEDIAVLLHRLFLQEAARRPRFRN
jgi:hypothetical protein